MELLLDCAGRSEQSRSEPLHPRERHRHRRTETALRPAAERVTETKRAHLQPARGDRGGGPVQHADGYAFLRPAAPTAAHLPAPAEPAAQGRGAAV